jgi:beta-phosphoglucomutase-like phosphatase (HAD superfamily)
MAQRIVDHLPSGTFRVLVTGDAVAHGKPHPEPYLTGVACLGEVLGDLDGGECVAIEDSEPGATSAVAAGLATIVVPNALDLPVDLGSEHWETLAGRTAADVANVLARSTAGFVGQGPA